MYFAGLDFITSFLHKPQKVIVVLRCDDKPVDGLLELLLPARAAFGFGVFLVVHALVLRWRDHRQPMFLAYLITELTQLPIGSPVASVGVEVHIVHGIEDNVIMAMPPIGVFLLMTVSPALLSASSAGVGTGHRQRL